MTAIYLKRKAKLDYYLNNKTEKKLISSMREKSK
jgi:hypothetical protein